MLDRYYIHLDSDGRSLMSDHTKYDIPFNGPTMWYEAQCRVPLLNKSYLTTFDVGTYLCEAEVGGWDQRITDSGISARRVRLLRVIPTSDRIWRLFSCNCAEHVFDINGDKRCKEAVRVSRLYADGEVSAENLRKVHKSASYAMKQARSEAERAAARASVAASSALINVCLSAGASARLSRVALLPEDDFERGVAWGQENFWQIAKLSEYLGI